MASRLPATTLAEPARSTAGGGGLGVEIDRDGAASPAASLERPVYNTPEKNVHVAKATAEELSRLEGEELPGNSKSGPRDTAESSSPHLNRHRGSLGGAHAGPSRRSRHRESPASTGRSSRNWPAPSGEEPEYSTDEPAHRRPYWPAPEASGLRQPAHSRLGPRVEPTDARDRIDRLVESRIAEEEGPAGPNCFGPRILSEPVIDGFQLPRDTPKYDGTAKPEDWLLDYSTVVGIARGNKRWAMRYSPLMLVGSARTWLNNLPAGSINSCLDFEEAFVSNFTGTYHRPGRPQQLEMCKQGPDETDREYLTRLCEMRNSCEGVHEIQAISFFMAGCRPNTMLWHKLRRSDPKTMSALMAIADKYALDEEAGKMPANSSPAAPRRDHHYYGLYFRVSVFLQRSLPKGIGGVFL
ncbi:hypothetical protein QYE76_015888 [Lolium multiflorum]|uniref:Retrotransposon gag domain-containing protein n=1 Tax=Lolium multiflorum TaxID=4521 RepID=A0AAD8U592_LOLMU|nr:hypothetical protein QYE76_015888 [Lolium multiflorum]